MTGQDSVTVSNEKGKIVSIIFNAVVKSQEILMNKPT